MKSAAVLVLLVVAVVVAIEASTSVPRLIEFGPNQRQWLTNEQIEKLARPGMKNNFMDVTDFPEVQKAPALTKPIPDGPTHQKEVEALLPNLKVDNIGTTIEHLENYHTRYYTTQTGKDAAEWIYDRYRTYAGDKDYISISLFENTFLQPSVIARLEGTDADAKEIVILGGHEDSTAGAASARSPGADDDASGSSTVLEIFRVLNEANFRPRRTIEFHAYAAEEAGLLGSQAIAKKYAADGVKVAGMLQLDMTAYTPDGRTPVVGLITDFVNATLTNFVATLIDEYLNIGYERSKCGYGCSDHASWTRFGYPSAFPFETPFGRHNPNIHTNRDTLSRLNLEHAIEFAKLGLAFVVELSLD